MSNPTILPPSGPRASGGHPTIVAPEAKPGSPSDGAPRDARPPGHPTLVADLQGEDSAADLAQTFVGGELRNLTWAEEGAPAGAGSVGTSAPGPGTTGPGTTGFGTTGFGTTGFGTTVLPEVG